MNFIRLLELVKKGYLVLVHNVRLMRYARQILSDVTF